MHDTFDRSRGTERNAAAERPHLAAPNSSLLCDEHPCRHAEGQRRKRQSVHVALVVLVLAASFAVGVATWLPNESPLLLLALFAFPNPSDRLSN